MLVLPVLPAARPGPDVHLSPHLSLRRERCALADASQPADKGAAAIEDHLAVIITVAVEGDWVSRPAHAGRFRVPARLLGRGGRLVGSNSEGRRQRPSPARGALQGAGRQSFVSRPQPTGHGGTPTAYRAGTHTGIPAPALRVGRATTRWKTTLRIPPPGRPIPAPRRFWAAQHRPASAGLTRDFSVSGCRRRVPEGHGGR